MKETIDFFKQEFIEAKDMAKIQWKSFTAAVMIVLGFYFLSTLSSPGWLTYGFIFLPALIVGLTALSSVNDIGPEYMAPRWHLVRIGLILIGAGAVMTLAAPFAIIPIFPPWRTVVLMWGMAISCAVLPPWEYYLSGKYKTDPHDPPRSPFERAIGRATGTFNKLP